MSTKIPCVLPPSEMENSNRMSDVNDNGRRYKVDILYGPTIVCGVLKHRTTRVEHIKEKLEKLGFEVKLRRTLDYDMVIFAFEGHTVFTCLATNLSVLGCSTNDPTVYRLISLMLAERNYASRSCKIFKC
ncbi:UPF0728 protein v1g117062-like [Acyrthosiphon pisum]|uniref:Uncharacterized protein n=1 Tax=Acyrthosiphon pisum TaxID=7029 RepID=A0A8R2B3W6_ACYPI|nr:UPF0728 protein v1g117062-like [Acyrthosiphon pisum]|eukprot:XP_008179418.1 PREDICTED: UPF0728 protein v1g117062-like [Acyrthosiphon pisum]